MEEKMLCPYCRKEVIEEKEETSKVFNVDYRGKRTGTFNVYHALCWENLQMMVEETDFDYDEYEEDL